MVQCVVTVLVSPKTFSGSRVYQGGPRQTSAGGLLMVVGSVYSRLWLGDAVSAVQRKVMFAAM